MKTELLSFGGTIANLDIELEWSSLSYCRFQLAAFTLVLLGAFNNNKVNQTNCISHTTTKLMKAVFYY